MDASGCGELLPWPTWPSWNYICLLKQRRFPCRDFPASQTKRCLGHCWPWKSPFVLASVPAALPAQPQRCFCTAAPGCSPQLVCALPGFGCVTCIMATLSLCFPQAQERVCGKVSVLTSTLHGALEYYVRALRCVPLGCRRGFLHAHFPAMRCMQILQPWGTCGAVPPLLVAMHFKTLAEPSSSAFEHLLSMAACWCRDRWNWNTPCPERSHLQD